MTPNQTLNAYDTPTEDFPILPNGMFRGQLEGLLTDINSHIGMSDALLKTLLTMIRCTRPSDWTDPKVEPVCSKMQMDLANQLCKSDRAVRTDEWTLEHKFGFITKHVSANGSRRCAGNYRQGLIFTPLIELVDELVALRDKMQRENQEKRMLKLKCSAFRRHIKAALIKLHPLHPDDSDLCEVRDRYLSWPRRYSVFKTIEDYYAHFEEVKTTAELIDDISHSLSMSHHTSGQSDSNFRRYIQDTNKDPSVICKQLDKKTHCTQSDIQDKGIEKRNQVANEDSNSKFISTLTPQRLFSLSSQEMQFYIKFHQGHRMIPSVMDFIQASIDRLPELGIHKSAYNAALDQMNDLTLALCILIIDRNRFHPDTPIKNPGGVLRAMTKRQKVGELNIVGSLIGLSERQNDQDQPMEFTNL